jgi:type III effector protein AvrRpm1
MAWQRHAPTSSRLFIASYFFYVDNNHCRRTLLQEYVMGIVCTKLLCGGTNIRPDGESPIVLNTLPSASPPIVPQAEPIAPAKQQEPPASTTTVANPEAEVTTSNGNALGNSLANAGKGNFFRSLSADDQDKAREVYKQSLFYHGTSSSSKASIRESGFALHKKTGGATATEFGRDSFLDRDDPSSAAETAGAHHYLTAHKQASMFFARVASPKDPGLVRVIGTRDQLRLETDPDMDEDDPECLRTAADIPATQVLQSKADGPSGTSTDACAVFRSALAEAGIQANAEQAAEMIAEIQTDSEDDFDSDYEFDEGDGYETVR